jgi:uncharacterized protein (TIGR02680 family)
MERWHPLRSGLVNLYRYDCEEFWFEQGRLLLRGNNGTGKSRVLALQLPFLLDGEVSSHRLEPDGDSAKRIEWNLLMGKHRDRLGYTWLEFGRTDAAGDEQYFTIGCGLHAVEGRGAPNRWFFVTTRRVGASLSLIAPDGHALSRDQLSEQIGIHGDVFTTAAAYRAAVNSALFRLSEHQYTALVGLLIQLRKPQLSRQLDEKALSSALGEALRPMPAAVIADVADAFRSLESDRAILDAFIAARAGADRFLVEYRRYAQIAARRSAAGVRDTHAAYERAMRKLREAEMERETAAKERDTTAALLVQLETDESAATAAVDTLRESPQMKSANELDAARRMAEVRETEAAKAVKASDRAREESDARGQELASADERVQRAQQNLDEKERLARAAAGSAGMERDHNGVIAPLSISGDAETKSARGGDPVGVARQRLDRLVDRKAAASSHVRQQNEAVAQARSAYEQARATHAARTSQLDDAEELHRAAVEHHAGETRTLIDAFRNWTHSLTELALPDADAIADALTEWCQNTEGRSPLATAVALASSVGTRAIASLRADAQQRSRLVDERLATLLAERDQLTLGRHAPPPAPHTRDVRAREERLGAPLWRLCDFREEVSLDTRAGLEAALEASGLLDAWVLPDGRVMSAHEHDTVIITESEGSSESGGRADLVLRPAIDRTDARAAMVSDDVIARVLSAIGLGTGTADVWIDADGSWRVGPLSGRWHKESAEHIGESARDSARRTRLAALAIEIEAAEREQATIDAELDALEHRERIMREESERVPDDGGVRDALASVVAADGQAAAIRADVAKLEAQTIERHRLMADRVEERDRAATDLDLFDWVDRLSDFDRALTEYRFSVGELFSAVTRHADLDEAAGAARDRFETSLEAARDAQQHAAESARGAAEAAAVHATMQAAVGTAVAEILERLHEAERVRNVFRDNLSNARTTERDLRVRVATAESDIRAHQETLSRDATERLAAIGRLEKFAATRLLVLCDASLGDVEITGWSPTRAVDIARRIEGVLSAIQSDDAAWDRSQSHIHGHLQTLTEALQPHGYDPAAEMEGEVIVVTTSFQGQRCTVAQLRTGLDDEIVNRQGLLDAREREILENHLVGEVAQHLHELLREGTGWVENMNRELSDRPMSTGMMLRFRWDPAEDGPDDFPEIRRRLLRTGATWSPDERRAVGAFLHRRIQITRAANEGGSWLEHLTTALDYRAWHRFSVERQQDGQWKRLTRRTHGTGSGGEKAIALTIPQFAAAAAHYRSADPTAPRLILLDEAFVGIDSDMRSKCMGLLAVFDLDFMMTSEREWACYATLPGVAIYQLATRPGIDAVGLTRWVWNGRQRVRDDHPAPLLMAPRATLPDPPSDDQPAFQW